jgi:hypothetical protein
LIVGIFNDPTFDFVASPVNSKILKRAFSKSEYNLEEKIKWKKDRGKLGAIKLLRLIKVLNETELIENFLTPQSRNKWLKSIFISETTKSFDFIEAQKELNRTPNIEFEKKLIQRIQTDFPWLAAK